MTDSQSHLQPQSHTEMPPVIVVVDPFSSGSLIAPEAAKRGYRAICVTTFEEVPTYLKAVFSLDGFDAHYCLEEPVAQLDFDTVINELKKHNIVAVITGSETGVPMTDKLRHALELPGNDPATSQNRRSKFKMHEALRNNNLRHISQLLTSNKEEMMQWAEGLNYRVVLKPVDSGGTDGVHVCQTKEQVEQAYDDIISMHNMFDLPISEVLGQQFIGGIEYVVDTVSRQGSHVVTNICQYEKWEMNGSMLYRTVDFIEPNNPDYQALVNYTKQALDALGVYQGAAHSEVKIDEEGPVLIESGARLQGSNIPSFVAEFADFSQLDLLVDAYLDPAEFKRKAERGNSYHKCAKIFGFVNTKPVKIKEVHSSLITDLPSHYSSVVRFKVGDTMPPTTSMLDSPGWALLLHPEESVVDDDMRKLEAMERDHTMYILERESEHEAV